VKAVLLHGYGGVDQLEYTDAPDPIPQPGEVLLRVISTSINPVDYKLRRGALKGRMQLDLPTILGRDVSGEVIGLGPGTDRFKVGDRVMAYVWRSQFNLEGAYRSHSSIMGAVAYPELY
jgi:NADPH:quinone reductase-like Zn-dependent oxidoreductase